jgi:hypothetical protein
MSAAAACICPLFFNASSIACLKVNGSAADVKDKAISVTTILPTILSLIRVPK